MRQLRLVLRAIARKAPALAARGSRAAARVRADRSDYEEQPPVVVISVPKSGTHLVHQIVGALPGTVDYGSFLATRASYSRRPRSLQTQLRRIRALAPGEILRSHILYNAEIAGALKDQGAFIIFVQRDPRDVVVSEAHYFTEMAPWHVLHREFAKRTPDERIDLAIGGLPDNEELYADVGTRFEQYAGWLDDADVVLSFEELASAQRQDAIERLREAFGDRAGSADLSHFVDRALEAIDPSRSHTFREGKVGSFHTALSPEQLARLEDTAANVLKRYGYALEDDAGSS